MQNDATRALRVIGEVVKQNTKSGAGIDVTYGQVFAVSGQECSVYLAGQREMALAYGEIATPAEGFRIPATFLVHPDNFVRVNIDERGHKWVEEVIPVNYPLISIDPTTGQIVTGDGSTPPSNVVIDALEEAYRGASLRMSASQPYTAGAAATVNFDTVEWDTHGFADVADKGFKIPPGEGGFYRVILQTDVLTDLADAQVGLTVKADGVTIVEETEPLSGGGGGGGGMTNPMTSVGDLIRGGTAGAPTRLAVGTTGQVLGVASGIPAWETRVGQFAAGFDAGSSVISTGKNEDIVAPFAGTITGFKVYAQQTGSITVGISKATHSAYDTFTDMVGAGNAPSISSAKKNSAAVSGWTTTTVAVGDIIRFNVASVSGIFKVKVVLDYTRT